MKRLLILICALIMTAALMTGCAKKAVDDASEALATTVSDIKDDAENNGMIEDDTKGNIEDTVNATEPTSAGLSEMIENGKIDDENDDDYDGDNIDDDQLDETVDYHDAEGNDADGGEHNDETMDNDSSFI